MLYNAVVLFLHIFAALMSTVNPSRVNTCAVCHLAIDQPSEVKIGCPNGCYVHVDCWAHRSGCARGVSLLRVRCGICWDNVELYSKRVFDDDALVSMTKRMRMDELATYCAQ